MKEVSTRAVINNNSSHSEYMKQQVMVNEILRILRNCNEYLEWKEVASHITYFVKRLQFSGYNHEFRYRVVNKALNIYDKNKLEMLSVPMLRENQGSEARNKKCRKKNKRETWYAKQKEIDGIMFVQPTANSELKKEIQKCANKNNMKLKVIEKVDTSCRK